MMLTVFGGECAKAPHNGLTCTNQNPVDGFFCLLLDSIPMSHLRKCRKNVLQLGKLPTQGEKQKKLSSYQTSRAEYNLLQVVPTRLCALVM